jgi:hypothetical protein
MATDLETMTKTFRAELCPKHVRISRKSSLWCTRTSPPRKLKLVETFIVANLVPNFFRHAWNERGRFNPCRTGWLSDGQRLLGTL